MKKILSLFLFFVFILFQNAVFAEDSVKTVSKTSETTAGADSDAFGDSYQSIKKTDLDKIGLSPIEKLYNDKDTVSTENLIRQAGYNFTGSGASVAATGGKFDNSYKLNVGEKLRVNMYGESVDVVKISGSDLLSPSSVIEVDTKGDIFIPGLGVFRAEGQTIGQVENAVNAVASTKYESLTVSVAMESGTQIPVFVYGETGTSGKILVGSNSTVYDVLCAAGGVKKTGTLRNIKYTSGGRTQTVDLYKLFFTSNSSIPFVRANDKIYVERIGDTVALRNGVINPGIYEIKKGENIQSVINYAGGVLTGTEREGVTVSGLENGKRTAKNLSWAQLKTTTLKSGDSVQFREVYNTAENTVTIQGNIKHPATYAYKDGMRLSDILKSENELLEETFITQAVIRRISGTDNKVETIPIFLQDFFAGLSDPLLEPRDIITIYKSTNNEFIDIYGCINNPKHLIYTPGMKLNDIMTDISFIESDIQESDVVSQNNDNDTEVPVALEGNVEENKATLNAGMVSKNKIIPTENIAVEITSKDDETTLYYLYDIMINSDKITAIKLNPEDKVFFRTLRDNEKIKKVKVSGYVKNPGVFSFVEGKRLKDMLILAGGLKDDAQLQGLVLKRKSVHGKQTYLAEKNAERDIRLLEGRLAGGFMMTASDQQQKASLINQIKEDSGNMADRYNGQIALNIKHNDIKKISDVDNIIIQDGDDIYIPRISDYVSVIGEVFNEQAFSYQKGKRAKFYIKQVGGYTQNANKFRLYKVGVNGRAVKISGGTKINQGDVIIVPRKVANNDWISPVTSTLQGLASLFIMAFSISKW